MYQYILIFYFFKLLFVTKLHIFYILDIFYFFLERDFLIKYLNLKGLEFSIGISNNKGWYKKHENR